MCVCYCIRDTFTHKYDPCFILSRNLGSDDIKQKCRHWRVLRERLFSTEPCDNIGIGS